MSVTPDTLALQAQLDEAVARIVDTQTIGETRFSTASPTAIEMITATMKAKVAASEP